MMATGIREQLTDYLDPAGRNPRRLPLMVDNDQPSPTETKGLWDWMATLSRVTSHPLTPQLPPPLPLSHFNLEQFDWKIKLQVWN